MPLAQWPSTPRADLSQEIATLFWVPQSCRLPGPITCSPRRADSQQRERSMLQQGPHSPLTFTQQPSLCSCAPKRITRPDMVVEYKARKSRVVVRASKEAKIHSGKRNPVFLFSLFSASLCLSQNGHFQEGAMILLVSHFS